jgi:hypothetical protein
LFAIRENRPTAGWTLHRLALHVKIGPSSEDFRNLIGGSLAWAMLDLARYFLPCLGRIASRAAPLAQV